MDAVAFPWKRHDLPRRLHYDLTAHPQSSWRVDEFLTALPRRPLGGVATVLVAFVPRLSRRSALL